MPGLTPYPFGRLLSRVLRELEAGGPVLDLPRRSFFSGLAGKDLSVDIQGGRASSPLGPAAGPHTQLAQNIALGWLAGARVFELKTVQIQDRLNIPRPCIDMRNVGYNVEWSQELTLAESLREYVKASMLVDVFKAYGLAPGFGDTLFDMSLGYDLAGLESEPVRAFVFGLRDAKAEVAKLRRELSGRFRDLDFTTTVSRSVTLSTFHGCPPGEIEAMALLLLESGLDVVVKLNPTLLGREEVREVLGETLGYEGVRVPGEAFDKDARWDQAAAFIDRLDLRARLLGRRFGVKFSNTLVVENPGDLLPASEKTRYLSGAPLHVLAMRLVRRLRRAFGDRIPVSFSAGIDRVNFPDAVALGLAPVTVCSDLLKPGGYGRLKGYYEELGRRMDAVGATDIPGFIRASCPGSAQSVSEAALVSTEAYPACASRDPRYAQSRNSALPPKVGTRLALFDCLACDKCVTACPNDSNFVYESAAESIPQVRVVEEGGKLRRRVVGTYRFKKRRQIAGFADFCNECGNCDVFCPEDGAPFRAKPRFFGTFDSFRDSPQDGFFLWSENGAQAVYGRMEGRKLVLRVEGAVAHCLGPDLDVRFPLAELEGEFSGTAAAGRRPLSLPGHGPLAPSRAILSQGELCQRLDSLRPCPAWAPRPPSKCSPAPASSRRRAAASSISRSASPTSTRRATSASAPSAPWTRATRITAPRRAFRRRAPRWRTTSRARAASASPPRRSSSSPAASPSCSSPSSPSASRETRSSTPTRASPSTSP